VRKFRPVKMKHYSTKVFVSLLEPDEHQQQQQQIDESSESTRDLFELHNETSPTITIANNPSNDYTKATSQDNKPRETWSNNCDYLITTLGGLIGLGK
jgi:hypothetical protein